MATRSELIAAIVERYARGDRAERGRILDEFAAVTGFHRMHAARLFGSGQHGRHAGPHPARRVYDDAVREALVVIWEASDRVCGKRLKPLVPILVEAMERHGHLQLAPEVRTSLLAISAATIDRALRDVRGRASGRPRRHSPPSAAVRRSVPVRTFSDWHEPPPGFFEADLVAHSGPSASGSFIQTLVVTDMATGWTECAPLLVREQGLLTEVLTELRKLLPFALLGFRTGNDSVLMNEAVLDYCQGAGIACTRCRPYRKNDQAWVEQKNGSIVRRFVGYHRLEGSNAVEALARLYSATRLFVNFFQPSFKLKEKIRTGSRVLKRYYAPETPASRLLASDTVAGEVRARLREITSQLDPLQLLDEIRRVQHHIVRIADGEASHAALPQRDDLSRFLASLSTAWRLGEVRPTHQSVAKPPRHWRTRSDPFSAGWSQVCEWLEVDPDLTGLELFERLQRESPGVYPDGQLRTLQRRLKHWRMGMARSLIFGVHASPAKKELIPPSASSRTSLDDGPVNDEKRRHIDI